MPERKAGRFSKHRSLDPPWLAPRVGNPLTLVQRHGGMGMSKETLAARLAQRLITNEYRCGDRLFHAKALGHSGIATT